jgi:hypothetical protein
MEPSSFWSLKLGDILTILAVGLSPLIAVLLQKWFEQRGATHNQRLWIFKTLMATRTAPLDLNHVNALNMIPLEFRDKRYKDLLRQWEIYLRHLGMSPADQAWNERRNTLLANLLVEMGKQLGFKFDTTHVTSEVYRPQYHGNVQVELDLIRAGVLQIIQGDRKFPVQLFPGNPEGAEKFEKLIDGTQPLRVELKRSKEP